MSGKQMLLLRATVRDPVPLRPASCAPTAPLLNNSHAAPRGLHAQHLAAIRPEPGGLARAAPDAPASVSDLPGSRPATLHSGRVDQLRCGWRSGPLVFAIPDGSGEYCAVPDNVTPRLGQSHPAQIRHVVMPIGPLPPVGSLDACANSRHCGSDRL